MITNTRRQTLLSRTRLGGLLLCLAATANAQDTNRPAETDLNPDAGRGGLVIVNVRLASGEELPMMVDSGTTSTVFDQAMEPKLGPPVGTTTMKSWGVLTKVNVYAMPKFSLGGVPLLAGSQTFTCPVRDSSGQREHPAMGIIGMDVLKHYCLQLDFTAGKVRFLDDRHADKKAWGRAFPIVPLNDQDDRPAVAQNLLGLTGPHSLIDSGCNFDGWLMPNYFEQWTNQSVAPGPGEARSSAGRFGGETYPFVSVQAEKVESDGIGLHFLARHLVTLDFPGHTLYLQRRSIGPLTDAGLTTTRLAALDDLVLAVGREDAAAVRKELRRIEHSQAPALTKTIARKLAATLEKPDQPVPAEAAPKVKTLPLGDARAETAEVGWLKPTANRIPSNDQIDSPLLDAGTIHATGLFAHAPSRYVYNLGGKWKTLRGEAGLHTAFQPYAYGVIFVIKADGQEVFRSDAIRGSKQVHYEVNLAGVRTLELIVEKAQDQNGGNWALWLDPTLSR